MSTSTITKNQIVILQTIINKDNNLKAAKEDIVSEASKGRTTSVGKLLFAEADSLIKALKKDEPMKKEVNKADPCHKMRGKILSHAHELGWHKKDKNGITIRDPGTQKPKIDFDRVNNWCIQYGFGKKRLDKYTYEELPKLVWQFQQAYKGYLKGF